MAKFRTQLSLIFGDDELVEGFIKPLLDSKELMPMIMKLLASYYYNGSTREAVDGVSIDSLKESENYLSDDDKALREMVKDMGASLQLFSMSLTDSKLTLSEGLEVVNSIAKATGGTSSEGSFVDNTHDFVPRVSSKGLIEMKESISERNSQSNEATSMRLSAIETDMSEVKSSLSSILELLQGGSFTKSVSTLEVSEIDKVNNSTSVATPLQVLTSQPILTVEKSTIAQDIVERSEVETPLVSEYIEHGSDVAISATEGKNLLQSLVMSGGIGGFN